MRDLLPMNAKACDTPCPGAPEEVCGGKKGTVSLYSLGGVNGYKGRYLERTEFLYSTFSNEICTHIKLICFVLRQNKRKVPILLGSFKYFVPIHQ